MRSGNVSEKELGQKQQRHISVSTSVLCKITFSVSQLCKIHEAAVALKTSCTFSKSFSHYSLKYMWTDKDALLHACSVTFSSGANECRSHTV